MRVFRCAGLAFVFAAFLLGSSLAAAHQPFCEFADLSAESPWRVPDAAISYAYYGNVYPADDIDYFRFEAEAGQRILLSLSIPAIEDVAVFDPVIAVLGPGIEDEPPLSLPEALEIPAGAGAMMIPLGDAPRYWFEPFGRKYYWNWDDYFWRAPESATYIAALWQPEGLIGRYAFVIGQREVFGGDADCFASYAAYWTPLEAGRNPYRDTVIAGDAHTHDHSRIFEVSAEGAPQVGLELFALDGGGYNARVMTENFTFAPQRVDGDAVPGEGHAHLYVDGEKIARVYGEWHFLASLPAEAGSLSVVLYANDHRAFAVNGVEVSDAVALGALAGGG